MRETQLTNDGVVVRSPRDLSQVFDVTSFLTVRWAYATLSMLGVLVGIVVLLAQLLVLDARRQTRQAAHVLTTRMGLSTRGEAIGLIAELGPALVVGAALGCAHRLDGHPAVGRPARLAATAPSTGAGGRPSRGRPSGAGRRARSRSSCSSSSASS